MNRKIKILVQLDRFNWFSDTFIKYYLKFFNKNELYFLFDTRFFSGADLTEYLKNKNFLEEEINIIPMNDVPQSIGDRMSYTTNFINILQKELLSDGSVLIHPDIDELIYHPNLRELLETFNGLYLMPSPIDVIHDLVKESDFNFNSPIFSQRSYYLDPNSSIASWYYKPLIIKDEYKWDVGRHSIERRVTDGLYLIHIGKIDYNFVEYLNKENLTMYVDQETNQNGITGDNLKDWFSINFSNLLPIPINILNELKTIEI